MLSFLAAPNQVRWSAIDGTEPMQSHWNELETNSSVVPSLYQELMTGGLFDADIMGWPVMQKKRLCLPKNLSAAENLAF